MDDAAPVLTSEKLADALRSAPSPTADDASITWDGRPLDSKGKVLRFLAELRAARKNGVPSDHRSRSLGEISPVIDGSAKVAR